MTSPSTWVAGDFRRLAAVGTPLLRHRSITHLVVVVTALAVAVLFAIPNAPTIKAGLITAPPRVESILPANVGVGVASADGVVLNFPGPMDRDAVRAALRLTPRTDVTFLWNADSTTLALVPKVRWATDQRYVIQVPAGTALADRRQLAADWRASFTTQTAPRVVSLAITEVSGTPSADVPTVVQQVLASSGDRDAGSSALGDVAPDASAATGIGLTFSAAMDHTATENAFLITPGVPGAFEWHGTTLWFAPDQRLVPGVRYAVSVAGARDADGIRVGGDTSFSFATRPSAQAMTVSPAIWASGVTGQTVTIGFSQPMDRDATAAAFSLADTISGQLVAGQIAWSADSRSLTFSAEGGFTLGHEFVATLGAGARDADGNPVSISWRFSAAAAARTYTYSPVPASPGTSDMVQYALNQLNSARASYGIAPLALDPALTAVAYGHAADMLANGYFSHDSLDGTTYKQRLTNAGISYGWSGENACYLGYGGGVQATLDWCHSAFWSEPYPGGGNHKDNILHTAYRRVGIGIATGSNKVYVVWDFTD